MDKKKLTLKEAQKTGKIEEFIKQHKKDFPRADKEINMMTKEKKYRVGRKSQTKKGSGDKGGDL